MGNVCTCFPPSLIVSPHLVSSLLFPQKPSPPQLLAEALVIFDDASNTLSQFRSAADRLADVVLQAAGETTGDDSAARDDGDATESALARSKVEGVTAKMNATLAKLRRLGECLNIMCDVVCSG